MRPVVRLLLALALLVVAQYPAAATAEGPVVQAPASIDATGRDDVTDALNGFLADAPDGSTVRFPAGARYRVEGTLLLTDRHGLTIEGNGALFFATTRGERQRRHWSFEGGSGITVRDVVVKGPNPKGGSDEKGAYVDALQGQHGFDLNGTDGFTLDHVQVSDTYGDFVYLGPTTPHRWTKHVVIQNSDFRRSGRQGITVTAAEDVLVTHNHIELAQRSTFDIEPNGAKDGARRIRIVDNDIGPGRHFFLSAAGHAADVDDIQVVGNRLTGKSFTVLVTGSEGSRRSHVTLVDNVSDAAAGGGPPISLTRIDGAVVRGNVVPVERGKNVAGVVAKDSCDVVVEGNRFDGATRPLATVKPPERCGPNGAEAAPVPPVVVRPQSGASWIAVVVTVAGIALAVFAGLWLGRRLRRRLRS